MPTVLRIASRRVTIYSNDHPPALVHVIGANDETIFWLNCPHGPAALRGSFGCTGGEIRDIGEALSAHVAQLCSKWRAIHGDL